MRISTIVDYPEGAGGISPVDGYIAEPAVMRDAGVDEYVAALYDKSSEGRARSRAMLRSWAP